MKGIAGIGPNERQFLSEEKRIFGRELLVDTFGVQK
jgi:hypothetical protein